MLNIKKCSYITTGPRFQVELKVKVAEDTAGADKWSVVCTWSVKA